jgi:DNA-binding XRE family transcriptional regulator
MNEKLKAAREARGWTPGQAAAYIGVDLHIYSGWEVCGIRPTERTIGVMCRLLRKSREELGF